MAKLSQKAYVLDNVTNNYYMTAVTPLISNYIRTYQRPYVHARTRKPQPTTTITIIEHQLLSVQTSKSFICCYLDYGIELRLPLNIKLHISLLMHFLN